MPTRKLNCWEVIKCGRQPGGNRASDAGICPVSIHNEYDGVHGGDKAGRACWSVEGRRTNRDTRQSFSQTFSDCKTCAFFQQVKQEEESSLPLGFAATPAGIQIWLRNREKMKV